jgi:Tol biopolymer transport system component
MQSSVRYGHRMGVKRAALVLLAVVAIVGVMAGSGAAVEGKTTLISDDGCCAASDGVSTFASISATGRYVAFASDATNLGAGGTEGEGTHVYLRDRDTDADGILDEPDEVRNEVISVDSDGIPGRGGVAQETTVAPAVSDNGRYVVFESSFTNLVPGDTNARPDIFIRDRGTATIAPKTERVSVSSAGQQGTGGTLQQSESIGGRPADVSNNGRYVAFHSTFTNLVPGDTNLKSDVFVRDRGTATIEPSTERVSVTSSEVQASAAAQGEGSAFPSISGDGSRVAFQTDAPNLSPDIEGGNEGLLGVVLRDRQAGTTTRVSVNSGGAPANMESGLPSISNDGLFVAFESLADNLNPLAAGGDPNLGPDVFVRDLVAGKTRMVSVNNAGQPVGGPTVKPTFAGSASISGDGRYVAFHYDLPLVTGDTNKVVDIYVRDLTAGTTQRASISSSGAQLPATSKGAQIPSISGNGRHVAFESDGVLVQGDTNFKTDIFAHHLAPAGPCTTCEPPRVTAVTPAENATLVGPATNVTATFSEPVRRGTVNTTNFTLREEGTIDPISAEVTYDPATKKATLNPFGPGIGENLVRGATYTATVKNVKDLDGLALDQNSTQAGNQPKVWSFTVRP